MKLPTAFCRRMERMLDDSEAFFNSYLSAPVRGLRINLLRADPAIAKYFPWRMEKSAILDEGFVLLDDVQQIGSHPFHVGGLVYMQEPSAMSVINAANVAFGERILDMCAAPGGKTSGLAARLNGSGVIVANEIIPSRAKLLARNVERMGIRNCIVTCASPEAFKNACSHAFDKVIVDAPCSGEGMFRKDAGAIAEWSEAHIAACATRQSKILDSSAECVRRGGKLIYSTCTFSPEENEDTIEAFILQHSDFSIISMERLYPHRIKGEGHFVAVLERNGDDERNSLNFDPCFGLKLAKRCEATEFISSETDGFEDFDVYEEKSGGIVLLPKSFKEMSLNGKRKPTLYQMPMVSRGVFAGEITKGRFEPSHTLYMASGTNFKTRLCLELNSPELKSFLHGDVIPCDTAGFTAVCVRCGFGDAGCVDIPLGFGKAVNGVLKNRLPKGLRING